MKQDDAEGWWGQIMERMMEEGKGAGVSLGEKQRGHKCRWQSFCQPYMGFPGQRQVSTKGRQGGVEEFVEQTLRAAEKPVKTRQEVEASVSATQGESE